jgi:tRNA pseudouridine13 synthase
MKHPYLTTRLPGTGGIFKASAEDFEVTEIPLYTASGSGEHTYALIEKRGLTTLEMLRRVSRALEIPERDIGYAGMKDARGITRQTVSIPGVTPEKVESLDVAGIKILSAARHNNKLRLGHLAGNSFRIKIREVPDNPLEKAEAVLSVLCSRGVPNYFGEQRYGSQGNSAEIGIRLLRSDPEGAVKALIGNPEKVLDERWQKGIIAFRAGLLAEASELIPSHCRTEREVLKSLLRKPDDWARAVKTIHPRLISLYMSAAQSSLFDLAVASRIDSLDRVEQGDVAFKHLNGACFLVEDEIEAAERAATFEISPTGPMFGKKMLTPQGRAAADEAAILEAAGLSLETFCVSGRSRLDGERRPLRVPLKEVSAGMEDGALLLEFMLPKGSYATSVLREVMKS